MNNSQKILPPKYRVLIALPQNDFDPSEVAIPWSYLNSKNIAIVFATPTGSMAQADLIMVTGKTLGILKNSLIADKNAQIAYAKLITSKEFNNPISYEDIDAADYSALILPGGHAKGIRPYLESNTLQQIIINFNQSRKLIAAICHGVLLLARSIDPQTKKSIIYDKNITTLPAWMELLAYYLTCLWKGSYYRTYPNTTTQKEVTSLMKDTNNFSIGPFALKRDTAETLKDGFIVKSDNIITARWPGDVHLFSQQIELTLQKSGKTSFL
jgi:protease I